MSPSLIHSAWKGSPLAQKAFPKALDYHTYTLSLHETTPQIQVGAFDGDFCVGGIVLAPSMDPQVGDCLMALHTYIHPGYRSKETLKAILLEARKEARQRGFRWMIFSKRTPWGILNRYAEV